MKKLLILLFTCITAFSFAQDNLFTASGKVTDSASKLPLTGASVFCQNTTLGTISNAEGAFNLKLPNGGYDLIVSYTGYETQVVRINSGNAGNLTIELKQKDKSLQEVAVVGTNEVPDGLAKYGQFFMDNFIGNTGSSAQCKIQNPEVLQFYFSKKRNRLKVKAKEELIIVNNALGYKIKFQLDSFAHEYNTNVSVYTGFPFFEELTGTDAQQIVWKQNREKAYKGSRLHFIRSWYGHNLENEGFVIEQVDPYSSTIKTTPVENPYDTILYKEVENKDVEINYNGKLRIIYKNALPDPKYLAESKLPAYLKSQITILDISDGFVIQQNGYFYDQNDVTNIGYWSWEKVADALPYDYKPG
jgi:CarboxypepD_reg-like domain